eukprot:5818910-Amphidinium_carterae.4
MLAIVGSSWDEVGSTPGVDGHFPSVRSLRKVDILRHYMGMVITQLGYDLRQFMGMVITRLDQLGAADILRQHMGMVITRQDRGMHGHHSGRLPLSGGHPSATLGHGHHSQSHWHGHHSAQLPPSGRHPSATPKHGHQSARHGHGHPAARIPLKRRQHSARQGQGHHSSSPSVPHTTRHSQMPHHLAQS